MALPIAVGRDPRAEQRTRATLDSVATILNQLILNGTLSQSGVGTWGLAGGFYTGVGAPPATLGYTGSYYLDLAAGVLYERF